MRIAVSPDHRLVILASRRKVFIFPQDPASEKLELSGKETGKRAFVALSDLKIGSDGRLYLLDAAGFVEVFDLDGRHLESIDIRHLGVYNPRALAIGPGGELILGDTGRGRVLVCDSKGKLLRQVGRPGRRAGELLEPTSVAVGARGEITVVDGGNDRIQRFDGSGKAVAIWKRDGVQSGHLLPQLAVGLEGRVWVVGGETRDLWLLPLSPTDPVEVFRLSGSAIAGGGTTDPQGRLYLVEKRSGGVLRVSGDCCREKAPAPR